MSDSLQLWRFLSFVLINGIALTLPSVFTDRAIITSAVWHSVMLVSTLVYISVSNRSSGGVYLFPGALLGTVGLVLARCGPWGLYTLWSCGATLTVVSFPLSCFIGLLQTPVLTPSSGDAIANANANTRVAQNAEVGNYSYVTRLQFDFGAFIVLFATGYNMITLWYLRDLFYHFYRVSGVTMMSMEGLVCVLCLILQTLIAKESAELDGRVSPVIQP